MENLPEKGPRGRDFHPRGLAPSVDELRVIHQAAMCAYARIIPTSSLETVLPHESQYPITLCLVGRITLRFTVRGSLPDGFTLLGQVLPQLTRELGAIRQTGPGHHRFNCSDNLLKQLDRKSVV